MTSAGEGESRKTPKEAAPGYSRRFFVRRPVVQPKNGKLLCPGVTVRAEDAVNDRLPRDAGSSLAPLVVGGAGPTRWTEGGARVQFGWQQRAHAVNFSP
ncbi:hypothetical protein SAMN02745898_10673 [Streptomyces sp. 136MFCol5.1]|nr:hypothetical protein SAMN02745898_10673 [Streptomyces sp. 136MFCol5.1]